MTDEAEFEAKLLAYSSTKIELITTWVEEHMLPVLVAGPFTSEGANAFATLMRDFAAFLDEHVPFIDPLVLPWVMYVMQRAGREPTQDELRDTVVAFARPDQFERFVDEFERLAEAG